MKALVSPAGLSERHQWRYRSRQIVVILLPLGLASMFITAGFAWSAHKAKVEEEKSRQLLVEQRVSFAKRTLELLEYARGTE